MLQLINKTPLAAAFNVLPNVDGVDTLYAVVKATLTLPDLQIADEQVPVALADEYHGEPGASSLKKASELHIGKAGTDVVLGGQAHAPPGRKVSEMYVAVEAAGRRKVVLVRGDRLWRGRSAASPPAPFEAMPLVWERAFGGSHVHEGRTYAEERNPVGVGFLGRRSARDVEGLPLPNLEDPQRPLGELGETPPPAGFGWIAPSWLPRRQLAGTYDERWQTTRAPYLPADFQPRFFNAAPAELAFDRFFQGGEPISVNGASKEGLVHFQIPTVRPAVDIKIAGSIERPPLKLETVLIEPDERRVCLSWRAEVVVGRRALKVEEIRVGMG